MEMAKTVEVIRWEDAAVEVTATGWACKKCGRWYGDGESGERAARYCCHNDGPCQTPGCSNRANRRYTICRSCQEVNASERWAAMPRVAWDGETPICMFEDDRYFFHEDDLADWMDNNEIAPEQIRLVLCEPDNGPVFDMADYLEEHLLEEYELDADAINATVNEWIRSNAPFCWLPTNKAISVESIRQVVRHDD